MRSFFTCLCLLASGCCAVSRATEVVDLAADLGYLRIHSLAGEREDLAAALQKPRALILDLRYPLDERAAGETLRLLLAQQPAKSRLYVLVSPATPVPVAGAIAANPDRLITLGLKGSHPEPLVVVSQTASEDRRAAEALAAGTAPADLISGRIDKERYDEAALMQEFKNGNPEPRPPESGPATSDGTPEKLTDRVLQRALHLHRALQALRR